MLSGGALGSLVLGMTAAALWRKGLPSWPPLSLGAAAVFADDLDSQVSLVWDWCVCVAWEFRCIGVEVSVPVFQYRTCSAAAPSTNH